MNHEKFMKCSNEALEKVLSGQDESDKNYHLAYHKFLMELRKISIEVEKDLKSMNEQLVDE